MFDNADLVKALREHAEWMGPNNYELPIAMYDDLLKAADALERLGPFGRLLVQYCGDPRGPAGRSGLPIEQEVLMQKPIEDVDGGKWIPVNAGALQELAEAYKKLLANGTNVPAKWISTKDRLPECEPGAEVGNITFRLKSGTICTGCFGRGGLQRDKYFRNWTDSGEGWDAEYVTHWVKLSDPEEARECS